MSLIHNALYRGTVSHTRKTPVKHSFDYPIFYAAIDLDSFETGDDLPSLLSLDNFNLFSLRQKDYGAQTREGLKDYVQSVFSEVGVKRPYKIVLLTMPRLLGYAFNPISIFYALDAKGNVTGVVYEVHNTFGERHSYAFAISDDLSHHSIEKSLYVSPFFHVDGGYRFTQITPGRKLKLGIQYSVKEKTVFSAALSAVRSPLTSKMLLKVFFLYPLLTLRVTAAIHFQALKLWLKKVPLTSKPAPPKQAVSSKTSQTKL